MYDSLGVLAEQHGISREAVQGFIEHSLAAELLPTWESAWAQASAILDGQPDTVIDRIGELAWERSPSRRPRWA